MEFQEYKRYKWFFTSSGKLVIGGKSALQNDEILSRLKSDKKERLVMHTSSPGSPFTIIMETPKKVTESDLVETAVFTASMSRAWREGKKRAFIDLFRLSNIFKTKSMNTGTWGVKKKIRRFLAPISLVLIKQNSELRAVPEITVKEKEEILLYISPGKVDKQKVVNKISMALDGKYSDEEILAALPTGGIKIKI